jgi:hypothetical protein
VDEADAELPEQPGRQRQRDGPAGDLELALVRAVEARQDLDQRRLAGAVLAQQAVDLACPDLKVDGAERLDAAEVLGEPASGQRGRPVGRPRIGVPVYWSPQSSR